jgi:NAD-dependent dihydropyrimidine dehydrogenase PreA subunit
MRQRQIIRIDEELCDGCGECITACAEGALALVDGKAKLVSETYCDGFGDCIGECPTGALTVEKREADPFDLEATRAHVERTGGAGAVRRLEKAAAAHEKSGPGPVTLPVATTAPAGGCPGSRVQFRPAGGMDRPAGSGGPGQAISSELRQWPVQLHLVQPGAPFFRDCELVIMNTCGPVASADVHWRFLRGRSVVVGCPKLDDTRPYAAKLAEIFREPTIPKVTVVRMEVPCCGGLTDIARQAKTLSGRHDLALDEVTVAVSGDVLETVGA